MKRRLSVVVLVLAVTLASIGSWAGTASAIESWIWFEDAASFCTYGTFVVEQEEFEEFNLQLTGLHRQNGYYEFMVQAYDSIGTYLGMQMFNLVGLTYSGSITYGAQPVGDVTFVLGWSPYAVKFQQEAARSTSKLAREINGSYLDEITVPNGCIGVGPGCDVLTNIPAGSVVGLFTADAMTYWQPGDLTAPLITLPAGKTAWVIGQDATNEYYKIVWVCNYLWVQKGTMGPNPDKVWNGAPLPDRVVK